MNLKKRNPRRIFKNNRGWLWLLASPLAVARVAGMPGIIATPTPPAIFAPPAMEDTLTNNSQQVFVPAGTVLRNGLPQPFQFGPVTVRPHVDYSFIYGNGIQAALTNQQSTVIQQISPGLLVDLGRHWSLDYTPTFRFYSSDQFKDGVDHAFSLIGGTDYEDWRFGLTQNFLYTTAPAAETGAQTEQETFGTGFSAARILNEKMSLNLGLNQNFSYADSLQNSRGWSTSDGLNYELWPRMIVGAGVTAGYVNLDIGSDQTYEQINAQVNWRATDKLSVQFSGGMEDRQYAASSQPDSLTPVFSGSLQYQPFADTQISVSGSRSVSPSLVPGSDTTATSFGANISQTLFRKFTLNLGTSYNISKFAQIALAVRELSPGWYQLYAENVGRTDDNIGFTARLSHPLLRRGTWSVFYQYADNQSTVQAFSYRSSQVGFDLSYRY